MRVVFVDINSEKGKLNRYFSKCVGAGRAAEVMRHKAYEQLKQIQRECPFEYIRFHGLFHDEMAVVSRKDDGSIVYNFQYIDLLFDSLLDIGIRPVVELGLMPDIMGSDEKYVFWWKMNITPPKSFNEWYDLIEATVRHFTHRYGEEEVKKWYFEVWNEPNHVAFFSENKNIDEYFKIYDAAAFAVKNVCSEYRVGGPASAGFVWVSETIAHCRENNVPLDFISSHYYCVKGHFDADGKRQLYMYPVDYLTDHICKYGDICHNEGYPLLLTEWSTSYSSRDRVHDSYYSAPFILETIKRCEGSADILSYWVYTDIFEEVHVPPTPFHGGFGLLNTQSLPKPAYYAYKFLNALGDTELVCEDKSAYVCKKNNEIQMLLWNLVNPDTNGEDNNTYFGRLQPARQKEDMQIELVGLEKNRNYCVSVETIGYKMGDVYSEYLEENFSELPTREETESLMERSKPKKTEFEASTDGLGRLKFSIPQTENQVDLVRVKL